MASLSEKAAGHLPHCSSFFFYVLLLRSFRFWDEDDNEYEIFSILSIGHVWTSVILAGCFCYLTSLSGFFKGEETNQFYYPQPRKVGFILALLIAILFFCAAKLWLSNLWVPESIWRDSAWMLCSDLLAVCSTRSKNLHGQSKSIVTGLLSHRSS